MTKHQDDLAAVCEKDIELKMMDADLPENDKQQVRFLMAWAEFNKRFREESRKGQPFMHGDIYDAFEAGVAHGKQYDPDAYTELRDENERLKKDALLVQELKALYRREMNCELSSFWDGGWTFKLGDRVNGFTLTEGQYDDLQGVATLLAELNQEFADNDAEREAEYQAGRL